MKYHKLTQLGKLFEWSFKKILVNIVKSEDSI